MSSQILLENTFSTLNINTYHPKQEYKFNKRYSLINELCHPSLTIKKILIWEIQLASCLKYDYIKYEDCPKYINVASIFTDQNKDIIYHTVTFERQQNTVRNDLRYIDCLLRMHCTLFQCILNYNINKKYSKQIALFYSIGKYFYSAAASSANTYNFLDIVKYIEQFHDMIELGMIKEIMNIFE